MLRKSKGGTHPWFSGHASGDDDNVGTLRVLVNHHLEGGNPRPWPEWGYERGRRQHLVLTISYRLQTKLNDQILVGVQCHVTLGSSNLGNQGVCLEEKGQRLANST
jgi:hypothetical protein